MFCTKCGKLLEEGQICECEKGKEFLDNEGSNNETISIQKVKTNDIKLFLLEKICTVFEFIKSPSRVINEVAQKENYKIGLFFLAIQVLISGFLAMLTVNRIGNAANYMLGSLGSMFGAGYGIDIPYLKIFFMTMVYILLLFVFLNVSLYIISRFIFKGKGSIKSLVGVLGVIAIPKILVLVLSFILVFVSLKIVLCINFMASIFGIILYFIGIKEVFKLNEDKSAYCLALSYLIYYILVIMYVFGNFR